MGVLQGLTVSLPGLCHIPPEDQEIGFALGRANGEKGGCGFLPQCLCDGLEGVGLLSPTCRVCPGEALSGNQLAHVSGQLLLDFRASPSYALHVAWKVSLQDPPSVLVQRWASGTMGGGRRMGVPWTTPEQVIDRSSKSVSSGQDVVSP